MAIQLKQLSGIMDLDSPSESIPVTSHRSARNIRFRNGRIENIFGNTEISFNKPSGINECIGSFYDQLKQRIIWANYNSNGSNGWYQYDIKTNTVTALLVCGVNSTTDILGFSLDYPLASINILYTTEADGDIIHWTDRLNRPYKLNLKDAIDNTYGSNWLSDYLTVNRQMPLIAPSCTYKDDSTVLVNNLRKTLYEFRYRYNYKDLTKSTWSPYSKLFAPLNPDDLATEIDSTKNNRIDVTVETGGADCLNIEIAARLVIGTSFSDNFLVDIINKSENSISDNSLYTYQFFNNSSYPFLDIAETGLLFSNIPELANTQELLNGNVIIYGATTEGVDFNVTIDISSVVTLFDNGVNPLILTGYNSGRQWTFIFTGVPATGDEITLTITVTHDDTSFDVYVFDYVVLAGNTIADIIAAFVTLISAQPPLTGVSTTGFGGDLGIRIFSSTLTDVVTGTSVVTYATIPPSTDEVSNSSYKCKSQYRFTLQYFDEFGVTNGSQTVDEMLITTPELSTTGGTKMKIPNIEFSVSHQPPLTAKYFSWGRALNQTVATTIPFVSCTTEKDTDYGYLEITNLQTNTSNFATYSFKTGDRLRIIGLFQNGVAGTVSVTDVPIVDYVVNPKIATVAKTGDYIKVPYVSASMSNFGGSSFKTYSCEIYTPAINTDTDAQEFFEFGETYKVLNPGTANRAHGGKTQDQVVGTTSDIVKPATPITATLNPVAGNLSIGDYYYIVEFSDILGRNSYPSTASTVVTTISGSQRVNLSAIALGATGVVARKIYRTKAGGNIYYLLTIINDNITTVYADNIADASLTVIMPQPAIYSFARGDVYLRSRKFPITSDLQTINTFWGQFVNVSDLYSSTIIGNGRSFVIDKYAVRTYYPTRVRWGGKYQQNTNVNQTNIFYPLDQDDIDRSRGDIQRLLVEERLLYVYQKRGVGQYGVYAKYIQNNSGQTQLVTTNDIITTNNINYLEGEYGLGDQYTGITRGRNVHYFVDPVRGYMVRRSGNGLNPISELYKGQYYIRSLFTPYNKTYLRLNGSKAKIILYYDFFEEQAHNILQGGVNSGETIESYNFSFNESRNAFLSFYDFNPEWVTCAEDVTYSWVNGRLYIHNNDEKYCNFYDTQYYPSIKVIFNEKELIKKNFNSVAYQSNQLWISPTKGDVYTSGADGQTDMVQESKLPVWAYTIEEQKRVAAFLRDMNSLTNENQALNEGNYLQGFYISVNFSYIGSEFSWLFSPYVNWKENNRNF